jgi:hypothetical protein
MTPACGPRPSPRGGARVNLTLWRMRCCWPRRTWPPVTGAPRPLPSRRPTRTADRLGAQPLAQDAAALARRAVGHGRRAGPVRAHRPGPPGARDAGPGPVQPRDRKGAVHERQDRQRARMQDSSIPVLGVAKSRIGTATHTVPVACGSSARLLFVTAAGMPAADAADLVRRMADRYRCRRTTAGRPPARLTYTHAECGRSGRSLPWAPLHKNTGGLLALGHNQGAAKRPTTRICR